MLDRSKISALTSLFCAILVALISWIKNVSFSSLCIRVSISIIVTYLIVYIFTLFLNGLIKLSNKEKERKAQELIEKKNKEKKEKKQQKDQAEQEGFQEMQFTHINKDNEEIIN